jgi:hypothetical protein
MQPDLRAEDTQRAVDQAGGAEPGFGGQITGDARGLDQAAPVVGQRGKHPGADRGPGQAQLGLAQPGMAERQ